MIVSQKEFIVVIEDRPGALAEVAGDLGRAGVNLTAFVGTARGGPSDLRFVASDPKKAEAWLKAQRRTWKSREVVAVPSVDEPGFVGRIAERLGEAGVNIEAAYHGFVNGQAHVLFSVDDAGAAKKALG